MVYPEPQAHCHCPVSYIYLLVIPVLGNMAVPDSISSLVIVSHYLLVKVVDAETYIYITIIR